MFDSSQFILPPGMIHRHFTHQGIIGKGRDFITGTPCTIHLYTDPLSKKKYAMQLYENITTEFMNNKIQSLVKSTSGDCLPNYSRVMFLESRKVHKSNELAVMYDVSELYGMSLENLLTIRIKNGEIFKEEEVIQFLTEVLDSLYFGGSKHGEYLEVTPINVFFKLESKYKYRYFPNNFGLNFAGSKWQKKYVASAAEFPPSGLEKAVKQSIFIVGLIALQMCTMQETQKFYNQDSTIDEKILLKMLQAIKLNFPADLFQLISGMCAIKSDKRLTLQQIYAKDGYLLQSRKVHFFQGKLQKYKRITGFLFKDNEIQCFAQTTNDKMQLYRGAYNKDKYQGYGLLDREKDNILMGEFNKGQFKYGICIVRNQFILLGTFQNGNPVKVVQLMLNIYTLTSTDTTILFTGKMNCKFEREEGRLTQKDGSVFEGTFVNGKKSGKGLYKNPMKRNEIDGSWLSDELEGKALYIVDGRKYDAVFRNGKLESKKQI